MRPYHLVGILLSLLLAACGDLSEQKANHQKLREGLKRNEIIRATENEIVTAAYQKGDSILKYLSKNNAQYWLSSAGIRHLDSLNKDRDEVQITFLLSESAVPEQSELQNQLLEAYEYSFSQGQKLGNNVQITDDEGVLFTSPLIQDNELRGMWSIWQSKSALILGLSD